MARYELMDLVSGNFAGIYETEAEALRDVAETVLRFGPEAIEGVALGYDDYPDGTGRVIADGPELVRRALAACASEAASDGTTTNGAAAATERMLRGATRMKPKPRTKARPRAR